MAKITTLFIADRPKNIESNYGKEFLQNVLDNVTNIIKKLDKNKDQVITSLAWGVELEAAFACVDNEIDFHVFLPYENQESIYKGPRLTEYHGLLDAAKSITKLSDGPFSVEKIKNKDVELIKRADIIYYFGINKQQFKGIRARTIPLVDQPQQDTVVASESLNDGYIYL